jgi:hypothetical protein
MPFKFALDKFIKDARYACFGVQLFFIIFI